MRLYLLLLCSMLTLASLSSCASAAESAAKTSAHHADHEPRPYDFAANARADVDAALLRAAGAGRKTLIVMGSNWCHDSRALAANFQTPAFETLIAQHYELVYVDLGEVKRGPRDRNIDIAQRYGIEQVVGSPTVLIISSGGEILNRATAPTWRNAASRSLDETYRYFEAYANQ